jgi:hypothetical protein
MIRKIIPALPKAKPISREQIISKVSSAWDKHPDISLGQFISGAVDGRREPLTSDDKLIQVLESYHPQGKCNAVSPSRMFRCSLPKEHSGDHTNHQLSFSWRP